MADHRIFRLRLKVFGMLIRETVRASFNDNVPRLGAALAFYALLSLAPLLVVMVAVAAKAYGRTAAEGQLAWQIQGLIGLDQARAVQNIVRADIKPADSLIATIISIITVAVGASAVVVELQDALNTIWHVPIGASTGLGDILIFLKQRIYSFLMILGAGFLLFVSVVLSAWIAAMGKLFGPMLPIAESELHFFTFVASFVVITFLFAAIYKIMPDVKLKWGDVWGGAWVASLTFTIGKQLIALYLGKAGIGSSYGAAGSLVAVLVWVYYSAQIFFFGAEFTKIYAGRYGSHRAVKSPLAPPTL